VTFAMFVIFVVKEKLPAGDRWDDFDDIPITDRMVPGIVNQHLVVDCEVEDRIVEA
jgi:hypothetical protein